MLQENEIARRLHEYMSERMTGMKVREVRIGVGYAAVALNKKAQGWRLLFVRTWNLTVVLSQRLESFPACRLLNF